MNRRHFLQWTATGFASAWASAALGRSLVTSLAPSSENLFEISLAQWSLHRAIGSQELDNLDFAKIARTEFDIGAIEYVNGFFKDKAKDEAYLKQMKQRAKDHDVRSLLIMVDGEGNLGDGNESRRTQAVENHKKWVDAAATLGCHTIRVNAHSHGTYEEQKQRASDGLGKLCDYASSAKINVVVENHGGLTSNGAWLAETIALVKKDNCGTLPDFGNWRYGKGKVYDRYQGVSDLMPFAKAVSAKSYDFHDETGEETTIDFAKIIGIVVEAGYRGHVGIEYEGRRLSEMDGIRATQKLLIKVREQLAKNEAGDGG